MKKFLKHGSSQRGRWLAGLLVATLGFVLVCLGVEPQWWTDRGVKIPATAASDYAMANQGQAKWFALQAEAELRAKLRSPYNDPIYSNSLPTGNNYSPINQGQFKNLIKPLYDRIQQTRTANPKIPVTLPQGPTGGTYPWSSATNPPNSYAPVNLGQLKYALSFYFLAVPLDTDGDGIPDYIEDANGNGICDAGETDWQNADTDGDGINDSQDSNPLNADPLRLGYWRFDNTNTWIGEAGQLPLQMSNLIGVASWDTNAMFINSTNPALLTYRDVETNGNANINLRNGTVLFWFKPSWTSIPVLTNGVLTKTNFSFTIAGAPASQWLVYTSSDLVNWDVAGFVTLSATGTNVFADTTVYGSTGRYYQLNNGVSSSLSIGFYTKVIFPGLNLIANQLDALPNNSLENVFAQTILPIGTIVQKWNQGIAGYDQYTNFNGTWQPIGSAPLTNATASPGEGIFIKNQGAYSYTAVFVGLVREGNLSVALGPVYSFVSSMVPQSGGLSSVLGYDPNISTEISEYTNGFSALADYLNTVDASPMPAGWYDSYGFSTSEPDVNIGDGLFINNYSGIPAIWNRSFIARIQQVPNDNGPAGRLIELGKYGPIHTNGWWSLYLDNTYSILSFGTATNGSAVTNLSAAIAWNANQWHQLALTYTPTNSRLYIDGQAFSSGTGVTCYPNISERANGFSLGGDADGGNTAGGTYENLQTYNYPLTANVILADYTNGQTQYNASVPQILSQPVSQNAAVGQTVTFTVTAASSSLLAYQWFCDGQIVSEQTNASLTLNSIGDYNAGSYFVVVSNSIGSVASSKAVLSVNPITVPGWGTNGTSSLVGWWQAEGNLEDSTGLNPMVTIEGTNLAYSFGENGQAFCFGTGSDVHVMASSALDLGGNGTGFTIQCWIKPSSQGFDNGFTFIESESGTSGSPVVGFSTSVDTTGDLYGYLVDSSGNWHDLTSTNGDLVMPDKFYHVAFTYDPAVGIACLYCNGEEVAVQSVGNVLLNKCKDMFLGYGNALGYDYLGQIDDVMIYNRALTSAEVGLCYKSGRLGYQTIGVKIVTQPASQVVTLGDSASFIVAAEGTRPLTYEWHFNSVSIIGATNANLLLANVQANNAGSYDVGVKSKSTVANSSGAALTVGLPPTVSSQPVNQSVAIGGAASFSTVVSGTPPLGYQWKFNGTDLAGATSSTLVLNNVQAIQAGNYILLITNAFGAALSSNAVLAIASLPVTYYGTYDSDNDGVSDADEISDGTDPLNANSVTPKSLGHWQFDDTNTWAGNEGQLPVVAFGLTGIPSPMTNAVLIGLGAGRGRWGTNSSVLQYRDVETNGHVNINCRNGSVRFWYKPGWNSTNVSAEGPALRRRLIEVGDYAHGNGWVLFADHFGTGLSFMGASNSVYADYLHATNLCWVSNQWYQLVLTYTPAASSLYINLQLVATGAGVSLYPNADARAASGFQIGGYETNDYTMEGAFDELETFNYPLDIYNVDAAVADKANVSAISAAHFRTQVPQGPPGPIFPTCAPRYGPWMPYIYPSVSCTYSSPEPTVVNEMVKINSVAFAGSGMVYRTQIGQVCPQYQLIQYASWMSGAVNNSWMAYYLPFQSLFASGTAAAPAGNVEISYIPTQAGNEKIIMNASFQTSFPVTELTMQASTLNPFVLPITVFQPQRLGFWSFNNLSLSGDGGQMPITATGVALVSSPFGQGVSIPSTGPVNLVYPAFDNDGFSVIEADGSKIRASGTPNIRRNTGTIRFWFKPNWTTGFGPANGVFLDMAGAGWTLQVVNNGSQIQLNSGGSQLVATPINWGDTSIWHQIAVTYTQTKTVLYIDGIATTGAPISYIPYNPLTTFRVGSDSTGGKQVNGILDELETFNYDCEVTPNSIESAYAAACAKDANGNGIADLTEFERGIDPLNPPAQLPIVDPAPTSGIPEILLVAPINAK